MPDGYCVVYKIMDIPKAEVYSSRIKAIARGDEVIVSYKTMKDYSRMWIGLYNVEVLEGLHKRGYLRDDDDDWETITDSKGKITFQDVSNGEYKVCLVFVWNNPYNVFKCSTKFEVFSESS